MKIKLHRKQAPVTIPTPPASRRSPTARSFFYPADGSRHRTGSVSHPGFAIEAVFPFPVPQFRKQTRNKTQPCTKYESYSPGFPLQNETRRLMRRAFDISSLYLELLSILVPKMVSQGPWDSPLAFHTASQIPHPLNFRFVLPGGLCGSGNPREYRQLLQFPQQR